jgi:two-component system chemotaxis response regulator CheB
LLDAHLVPVVMVSALTQEGADVTFEALELGAVDYMPKPERYQLAEMRQSGPQLVAKVLSAAKSRVRRPRAASASPARRTLPSSTGPAVPSKTVLGGPTDTIVVIGISTGGPQTLASLFPQIEPPMPAIVVVQHMPARFTYVLAERLNRSTALHVKEAEHGEPLLPSHVYIAPGGRHLEIAGTPGHARIALGDAPPVSGHRPSVDVLFQSAARVFGKNTVGFIMTGMGRDGVDGCKAILAAGGATYGQDEATSIVYGMNKAAQLEGAVRAQFAAEELPTILRLLSRRAGE